MISNNPSLDKDDRNEVDFLLADLSSGRLAGRIADAARLAVAKAMLLQAQEMQSAVEAENSACSRLGVRSV
jgi:ribosomal protein S9